MKPTFPESELNSLVNQGLISRRKHPEFDLWILNYTEKCTFQRHWDDVTEQCRGLIVDGNFNIVSRPFRKFFTLNEWIGFDKEVPNESFEVYDKLDGSLGITYVGPDGKMRISTRGSFESPQAIRGNQLFQEESCCHVLDPSLTFLFEIICKESTYVVDYEGWEGLVLTGCFHTDSGVEVPIENCDWKRAERYDFLKDFSAIPGVVNQTKGREGVVVKFRSGLRLKVKSDEYHRLFKIVSSVSKKHIWEMLRSGATVKELTEIPGLPEWTREFIEDSAAETWKTYNDIEYRSQMDFMNYHGPSDRKSFAAYATQQRYPSILFALHDGQHSKAAQLIWKFSEPKKEEIIVEDT